MYLLDANVLIIAKKHFYQFDRVPPFWAWLSLHAENGQVGMPIETWNKVGKKPRDQRDDLAIWAIDNKDNLVVSDRSYDSRYSDVLAQYAWPDGSPLSETDIETIGDDYSLIACALCFGHTVVTHEVSKPKKIGPNRHIPDVCGSLGVTCIDLVEARGAPGLIDILDFRVS